MSAPLTQRIAFRVLPPHLKSVLLTLANYAHADGTQCRPSLATVAAWTGRSLVRTKVLVRELRARGLIAVTRPHAPHRPAEYRLVLAAIEALPSVRRDAQQLSLFAMDAPGVARFPQGDPRIGAEIPQFSTVSTGVHRSPAISTGITGDPRSVKEIRVQNSTSSRARARHAGGR